MTSLKKTINAVIVVTFVLLSGIIFFLSFTNFKNDPVYIQEEFVIIFNEFRSDAKRHKVVPRFSGLTTTFVDDIENEILGYCIPAFNTVRISKKKWNTLSDLRKKLLLYHEWGHCTLRRNHLDSENLSCPLSIMHPYINPTASCYPSFNEWYDRELFTNPYKTDLI